MKLSYWQQFIRLLIRSRWKRWIIPFICTLPYLLSIMWLLVRGQIWISQVMLAPIIMTLMLFLLTYLLAKVEFRR